MSFRSELKVLQRKYNVVKRHVDGAAVGAPHEDGAAPIPPVVPVVEEARQQPQDTFWGFVKELQMLVVGFVTSLLPGFHAHVD